MNREVYKKIAKQNGVSVAEVKKEIQSAINQAYINPNPYARCVPKKGDIPTVEEFLEYTVNKINAQKNK